MNVKENNSTVPVRETLVTSEELWTFLFGFGIFLQKK